MFCALQGHTGERLQDHWSSGFLDVTGNTHIFSFGLSGYQNIDF